MKEKNGTDLREKRYAGAALVLMIVYAVIGLFLFDDYGCGPDEGMERQTSLVNFKYAVHKLNIPVGDENEAWMDYLPELKEYRDRYYGTALHFPLVIIESLFHFTLEPAQFYGMRHFYTFFWWYIGVICFYFLLTERFGSRKYGLAGILMMILTPRFFAESFYNNKDVIFTAWYVITAFVTVRWFRVRSIRMSVLLAFVLALTCNTRFNGIVFIPVFCCLFLFDALRCKKAEGISRFFLTLILFLVFFWLITPNFWENPFRTLAETLQFNMRHPNHGSDGNLFNGVLVDAARTRTFIPVWILLTVPSVYLLFSFAGTLHYVFSVFRDLIRKQWKSIDLTDTLMFVTGFAAVIFIILTHVTIYNAWRHCYFVFPCIIFFAAGFLSRIGASGRRPLKIICAGLLSVSLLWNAAWIVRNHPFEYVYFAPVFSGQAERFSGDYWGISSRALLEYITKTDPERMLLINHAHTQAGSINRGLLPEEKRQYLTLTYEDSPDVDYYIVCRDDILSTDIGLKGYEKVYSVITDGNEIAAVYKKAGRG